MQNETNEKYQKQISIISRCQQGDKSAEKEVFEIFKDLIKMIVREFEGSQLNEDELIQAGRVGLWKGIYKYDVNKCNNPKFYLKPYIRGEMLEEIRKSTMTIPRHIYYKVKGLKKERNSFEIEHGRTPNNEELAERLGVSIFEIDEWCQAECLTQIVSIDKENGEDDFSVINRLTDGKSAEDVYISNSDAHDFILESIDMNVQEASNEVIESIIEQAEFFAKQYGLDRDEFLQVFKMHLKKGASAADGPESEKEKILNAIFMDTNFYWPFSYRLIAFIKNKRPDLTDVNKVAGYLIQQMEIKGIPYMRESIEKWFKGADIQKSGEANFRDSMYKICFAMELDVNESKSFFKQVVLDKAFYIRDVKEFIYYYCIKSEQSYQIANELIEQALIIDSEDRENHTLHETKVILENLIITRNDEKLLEYIRRNPQDFNIRNLTARKHIDRLINDICISDKEKDIIEKWQDIEKRIERIKSTLMNDDATSIEGKRKYLE